jgi:CPA2 family monovalent cation:H+ antiporter-2
VGIIGSDEQLKTFQPEFSKSDNMESDTEDIDIVVKSIEITDKNRFIGQTIRDSGLREKTNGLVIGIERKNERILNPVSTTVFEKDDIIWLAADRTKIREIIDFNTSS